ncbi:MAG TPA: hypothetical protein DCM59_10035 [Clostridium sp.]|nr:hypothetical protein [Clostridium sp.]
MKKKFIALIICGALACTALVGLAFQNSIESANNSKNVNKSIIESVDKENEVEQKETNKVGLYNEENSEAVGSNNDGGNENTTRFSRGGQDTNLKSNETVATNNQRDNLDKTEKNSTSVGNEEEITYSNPSNNTNRQETSTPSQGQANKPNQSISSTVQGDFSSQIEQFIFTKVNEERVRAGMSTLSYSGLMEKYARIKSQDMGDRNYFDHKNPEGELITAQMDRDGISYRSWGENIAYIGGVSDINELANQFMTNWMNSQGHRENILSPNFTSIGVGVYKVGNRYYATQEFYK